MSDAVVLQGVSKVLGGVRVLDGIDLTCAAGRTTVLIGPSGCGKSTLLRTMVGLLAPDGGHIRIGADELLPSELERLRRRIGYVIQEGGLFPHLDARGNAALMARHLGWEAGRIAARIAQLCALTRFPVQALERFPAELSGGQRQRLALMRALMLDPDVLLLDEPLGALDPMIRAELSADLRGVFRSDELTVVMVTHDMGEAAYFADEVVLLREGRIVQQGRVRELYDAPAEPFVEQFVRAQLALLEELS